MVLNAELNVDPTARYSRCMFSKVKVELNVDPIARSSKCVECRAESRSPSPMFSMNISNAELNVEPKAQYVRHINIKQFDYIC